MSAGIPPSLRALAVPVDSLFSFEANPRRGDSAQIRASLQAHGQYRPIVVNARDNRVLAGNHQERATRSGRPRSCAAIRVSSHAAACQYGMEISPAYCDVIAQRWEKHTGRKARRPRR